MGIEESGPCRFFGSGSPTADLRLGETFRSERFLVRARLDSHRTSGYHSTFRLDKLLFTSCPSSRFQKYDERKVTDATINESRIS